MPLAVLAVLAGLLLPAARAAAQPRVELGLAGATDAERAEAFGVGGIHRPGDEVGIRVSVRAGDGDFGAATNVLVQWEMPNADGDIAEIQRVVALTAGGSTTTWLYGGLPPDLDPQQTWTLRAFVYDDEAGGARGAEIGTAIIQAPAAGRIPPRTALVGLIGRDRLGLDAYRRQQPPTAGEEVLTAHEDTRIVPLEVADLPDAWPGLDPYGVVVWSEGEPAALTARQEEALRDWIAGGGHLVIVLPFAGDPWRLGDAAGGPLSDLLPTRAPRLVEDVSLSSLVPILSKSRGLAPETEDRRVGFRSFADLGGDAGAEAIERGWAPLVVTGEGEVVAMRRPVGHGHLSVVGLELTSPRLEAVRLGHGLADTLPQADAFWNRVLGRRAAHPTAAELGRMADRVARTTPERRLSDGGVIADQVTMSEAAGTGLLLALVLFVGYWLLAGPIGFAMLKARGQVRHAWMGFVVAAAVFTGFAWVGVTALRKRDVDVRHLTVLDWVADDASGLAGPPQLARARSWMSLYLPSYGTAEVGIDGAVPAGGRARLDSWVPAGRARPQPFPNPDRYAVDGDGRAPGPIDLPARATVTQLDADWRGTLPEDWGGILRSDPDDPVRIELGPDGEERLAGSLVNRLPGAIRDVTVVWVRSDRLTRVRYLLDEDGRETVRLPLTDPDRLDREVEMWSYAPSFDAGRRIPLDPDLGRPPGTPPVNTRFVAAVDAWMDPFESEGLSLTAATDTTRSRVGPRRVLSMLSIFDQLPAPAWMLDAEGRREETVALERLTGRELDLSAWFARPCVVVMGFVDDVPIPVPLTVDGERVGGRGTVMMRWVLPLETDVERAFAPELEAARARAETEAGPPAGES